MTALPEVPPGCQLIVLDRADSTSEEAKRLAVEGAEDRTVVWAHEQSGGRGRHGRSWESPPGNLYLSILLRPDCEIATASQIGFAVGAAMARAIRDCVGADAILKWPNDLLLDGRKIAGILLESADAGDGRIDWVVAGVGVNVDIAPDLASPGGLPAGSLQASGYETTPSAVLEAFLSHLFELLDIWERDGFGPLRALWSAMAMAPDTALTVKMPEGTVEGTFGGIDHAGNLMLTTTSGPVRVAVGDVFPVSSVPTGVS